MSVTFGLPILDRFTPDLYTPISLIFTPKYFLRLPPLVFSARGLGEHAGSAKMRGGGGHTDGKKYFPDEHAKLFWCTIYCANPRPNARSQPGYCSHRGLLIKAPRIICEYDLANTISI